MIRLLAAIFMMVAVIAPASAQVMISTGDDSAAAVALPDPLTPEAVREVVSQLSDADVRRLLLERLDAVAEAEAQDEADASGGLADFADKATFGVLHSISDAVGKTPLLLQYQVKSFNNFFDRLGTQGIVFLLIVFGAALSVGLAVERLFLYLTRRWHKTAPPARRERTLRETVSFLFRRLCADVLGLVVFFFAVSTIGPIIGLNLAQFILDEPARILPMISQYIGGIWVSLIVLPRIAAALGRFFLAPGRPDDRLLHIDEASARFIFVHQIGFFFLVGFSYWIFQFNDINGVAMGESRLGFWLNIAIHSYLAWLIWTVRDGMTMMLRGPSSEVTATEEKAAQIYPLFIVGVSIGTWYLVEILVVYELWELIASAPHVKMMLLLAFAPTMDTLVRGLVRHVTPPMTGEGVVAEAAYKATKRSYIRIGRIIAFAVVVLTIGQIWGIDFKNLAAAGVGAQVAGRGLEILMIIAFGYLVWELVSLWINRKLAAEQTAAGFDLTEDEPGGGEGGGAGGSRLSTVLPLVLGVMKAAIATIFGLIALGNIGIDITPLLAGAGIIGLAVGFGAQKLVADVVSGIFFLVDDAFRTGEYVEVEGT
ncbi:MAG: mechanosensitive ion channel family protein, partial [Pseudomonadota bacterium]